MDVQVDNEHDVILTLNPLTPAGNPSQVQPGTVEWQVASGDLTMEDVLFPDGHPQAGEVNELSKKFITHELGPSIVTVSADADLGEGVRNITDNANIVVNTPQADNLGLSVNLVPKATP